MPQLTIQLNGKIQGVGFRPFLLKLARQLDLAGFAMNTRQGLTIQIAGDQQVLDIFLSKIETHPPRYANITHLHVSTEDSALALNKPFEIRLAEADQLEHALAGTIMPADRALCKACLDELFDRQNRRYLHPFISCIECGPRASSIRQLPFERQHSSFAEFSLCPLCRDESYELADDSRRFHAQTNACWDCGPRLSLYRMQPLPELQTAHKPDNKTDVFEHLAERFLAGEIIALKGLSGFHLIADARQHKVVERLRLIKQRPDKPFAVMALNVASLPSLVEMNDAAQALLESEAAPIVLIPKTKASDPIYESLAPGVSDIGCMLPNTALHYLLFYALLNKPTNPDWLTQAQAPLLIVTSANSAGEPLIFDNQSALQDLPGMADWVVTHDREIVFPSDDSVIQSAHGASPALVLRRARGFAPETLPLHSMVAEGAAKTVLACGAYLKNTFCISRGEEAFISTHLGEQNSRGSYAYFEQQLDYCLQQFSLKPDLVACDLHPDFFSSRFAESYAATHQLPLIKVAHHEAHIASVLNDCQLPADTMFLGLALDGLGLGKVGAADDIRAPEHLLWGGELYWGKLALEENGQPDLQLKHLAHLSTLTLPGGDKATQEIARIGYALQQTLPTLSSNPFEDFSGVSDPLKHFIEHNLSSFEHSSSLGRWFDGVASILGIRQKVSYEGQAAMELEALAREYGSLPQAQQLAQIEETGRLNLYPILEALFTTHNIRQAAALFHSELVDGLLRWLQWASRHYPANDVLCSGGCFQNRIIREQLILATQNSAFSIHFPAHIPVNDAGISLGQALIATLKTSSD